MTTLVEVERGLTGLPARIPDSIAILNIKVPTPIVHRYIVVTITGDATELGILIKAVSTCGVTNQREEVLIAQIVDPGPRGLGICNDILTMLVVKVTVTFLLFHKIDCFKIFVILLAKLRTYSETTKDFSKRFSRFLQDYIKVSLFGKITL
jgi:hypothetical protein